MISINNLSYAYSKKEHLFKDLSFNQTSGSIVGLLGKNGAGKSTLLKLITGLLYSKTGEIRVNGSVPHKRDPDFLSNIFFVNDDPFLPSLTVKSYLKVYGALYKYFDSEKMRKILQEFEIHEHQYLNGMSYGQQKKFIMAFALSTNCKALLLDEPTNGLDIPSKKVFRKVLVDFIEDDQLVIISTHQVKDVETLIDKIVHIENGHIVFEKDVLKITEAFQFKTVNNISDLSGVLYSEKCPGGYKVIMPAENNEETELDIELLFNAISNNAEINL
jgi:ABC-2 type transport system ATP-binding protein